MSIPDETDRLLEPFRRFTEDAVSGGDIELIADVFATDAVVELPMLPAGSRGPAAVEQAVRMMRGAFPDLNVRIEDAIGSGDRVWVLGTAQGTNTGPLFGRPATDRAASWPVMHRLRFAGGRITQWSAIFDRLELLQQLGLVPQP